MFDVRTEKLKQLESDLKTFKDRAYPFATRNTLNRLAFDARGSAQRNIRRNMTTRNKFTIGSVQVEQTRTLNVSRQMSIVGSTQGYMEVQEFGGIERKKGKHGVAIPTTTASGEGRSVAPRKKLPRAANRMQRIKLGNKNIKAKNRKQALFLQVKQAIDSGKKYVFLDTQRRQGIYRIKGRGSRAQIDMVHDLTREIVRIPRNPWLAPAVKRTEQRMPSIHIKSLQFQLKHHGLFRG